ncbi:hypothetical protein [Sphingobium xenophagum]|uniref:hypothetical protein n=1 Tax=Sphingobium xenophagum TaxID=121428 RepID=UPI0036D326CD|tara:strand:- start:6968 stop:7189 length:222 start_codon:yes stop_codon:yes gene_type:complete
MSIATVRRNDSAKKSEGRTLITSSSPANFVIPDANEDKPTDWRAQLLMQRHHVTSRIGDLILALHFGEVRDAG